MMKYIIQAEALLSNAEPYRHSSAVTTTVSAAPPQ